MTCCCSRNATFVFNGRLSHYPLIICIMSVSKFSSRTLWKDGRQRNSYVWMCPASLLHRQPNKATQMDLFPDTMKELILRDRTSLSGLEHVLDIGTHDERMEGFTHLECQLSKRHRITALYMARCWLETDRRRISASGS